MARVYASNAGFYLTINRVYARHFPTNLPHAYWSPSRRGPWSSTSRSKLSRDDLRVSLRSLSRWENHAKSGARKPKAFGGLTRGAITLRSAGARHRAHAPRITFRAQAPRRPRLPMLLHCLHNNTTALSDQVASARSGDARPNEQRPIGLMSRSCFVPSRTTFRKLLAEIEISPDEQEREACIPTDREHGGLLRANGPVVTRHMRAVRREARLCFALRGTASAGSRQGRVLPVWYQTRKR